MQQSAVTAERQAKRAEAFVAPVEKAEPTVEEKLKKKRKVRDTGAEGEEKREKKKKKKQKAENEDGSS